MNKDIGELSRDIEEEESKTLTNSYNVRKLTALISNSQMKTMVLNLMVPERHLTNRLEYLQHSRMECLKTWSKRMKSCKGWKGSEGIVRISLLSF